MVLDMKYIFIIVFFIFITLSKSGFSKSISQYKIDGISIGDSLLNFMDEEQILRDIKESKKHFLYLKEPYKYSEIYVRRNLKVYDMISVFIKNNEPNKYITKKEEKYKIVFVRGIINYDQNFNGCLKKREELEKHIFKIFTKVKKIEYKKIFNLDPSGKSYKKALRFNFFSGDFIEIECTDWEEEFKTKNNFSEGLGFIISLKEINDWFIN